MMHWPTSILILGLSLLCTHATAQTDPDLVGPPARCNYRIDGHVLDEHDAEQMAFANIYIRELERGVEADENGYFLIEDLCTGALTLRFSHIGCDPLQLSVDLSQDTTLDVYLHHHDNYTQTVTVTSSAANLDYEERLDRQSAQQLSTVLEGINGVSSLRTGTAAAKPIYDGLYGNRLSVQNNGITQSGQQWGNDHAPEIDPWVAAYVRVIEGVEALRYGGSTLGPTVLIEPAELTPRTRAGGKVAYGFRGNGLGHTLNARVTDSAFVTYRLSGSLKLIGDQRAPGYYLTNTGQREGNVALQLAKFISPKLTARAYYSLFNAQIGVLRGSHIGNLSDLQEGIGRDVPFFTEPDFSYSIASPRQTVSHHLLKGELVYQASEAERYSLRYGGQLDDRKEFDVRRGSDDQAALKLLQYSHFLEGHYQRELGGQQHAEAGLQLEAIDNNNQPGTGILPLIPDYNARRASAYATYHREGEGVRYHFGARYDYQYYQPVVISRDSRSILRYRHYYGAVGGAAGASFPLSKAVNAELELTVRERAPQINELYSQGLHQGVSGIEEGDRDLAKERSGKLTAGIHYSSPGGKLTVIGSGFVQRVDDFINLEPQPELRLTIRGAFPVFQYRGVDADLYGAKIGVLAQLGGWEIDSRLALLDGTNRTDGTTLIYLPPTNWRTTLSHPLPHGISIGGHYAFRSQTGKHHRSAGLPAPAPRLLVARPCALPSARLEGAHARSKSNRR